MRRDAEDAALARARIALRLGGAGPARTAARRAAGRRLPDGLPPVLVLAAAEPGRRDRVAARAAACAHAARVATVVAAAERADLAGAIGEDVRRFAVGRRADLAALPPPPASGSLPEDWAASRDRIAAALAAHATGRAAGWAEAGLGPAEAAALDLALAAEEGAEAPARAVGAAA